MERSREARRGSMAAVNGAGLSRRRQRSSGLRDSLEEDGAMEMPETSRLRERTSKRDRERDRSTRSKRRRGERVTHGSGREEGEDSSEDSIDEDEEDEDDQSRALRPPPPPQASSPVPSSSSAAPHNSHLRKSLPLAKPVKAPPAVWKVGDEMMGVSVPRKARSAYGKRLQDGGGSEQIHRQPSTSPSRPSTASTVQVSPSSSNANVRKKIKPISGTKQRPPKISKSSSIQEIEIEVAEVLFGLTRQFQSPSKQESHKLDTKDINGSINEAKSKVSSPISATPATSQPSVLPPSNASSNQATTCPKKKRLRPVKVDGESATSLPCSAALPTSSVSAAVKPELEQPVKPETFSPRSEKNMASPTVENSRGSLDYSIPHVAGAPIAVQQDSIVKPESIPSPGAQVLAEVLDGTDRAETKEDAVSTLKGAPCTGLNVNVDQPKKGKGSDMAAEKPPEEKFSIDLMAPPGKLSPERVDYGVDHKTLQPEVPKICDAIQEGKVEAKSDVVEMLLPDGKEKTMTEDFDLKKQIAKERSLDLQLNLEKPEREGLGGSKQQSQKQQLSKAVKAEPKSEKAVLPSGAMPFPMPVSGWPGNLPPLGYMGQVPSLQAILPLDSGPETSKALQPPRFLSLQSRPKRCGTHCYIAQNIYCHQQLAKMNPLWPAAAGAIPLYGPKPYNLNVVSSSESAFLGNPLHEKLPGRSLGSVQNKCSGPVVSGHSGHSATREKGATDNNALTEGSQRKQLVLQQAAQPGLGNTVLPGPAFIFPLNQHMAGVAAAAPSAPPKTTSGTGNAATANSGVANSGTGVQASTMNFNYTALPQNEAQYFAILQNHGYPLPVPAHVGSPSAYRGASPAQAMTFFNGSFYSSPVLHPSQLQQQSPCQQPPHARQGHQNTSTSSGSSSSQKQPQNSQQIPGNGPAAAGGSAYSLASSKRLHLSEATCEDSPSTADSRVSQAQKSVYGHNFAMSIHPQNFALISPATTATTLGAGGGRQSEKQSAAPNQGIKVELAPPQAFAMSFASFTGAAAAAPEGLDFLAIAQNHALFQSLPEAARHGYQISAAAGASQVAQQHKKAPHQEDGKSAVESTGTTMPGKEEKKMLASTKGPMSGKQHSFAFPRQESEAPLNSSILSNSVMASSSQTLNIIPAAASNGSRAPSRTANAAPTVSSTTTAYANSPTSQQPQNHLAYRSKSSAASNSPSVYSERLPAGSMAAKFPQALSGGSQVLIQNGGGPSQSPQWRNSSRIAAAPAPSPSAPSSSVKTQLPQRQSRVSQQTPPTSSHQTQICFGVNSLKMAAGPSGQGSMSSFASANSMVVGSPPNSVAKISGNSSPHSFKGAKSMPPASSSLPLTQQSSAKNPPSSLSLKPSPVNGRNAPSIVGQPHMMAPVPSLSSGTKQQQQQSQPQQKQPFPPAQFFFSNTYMPPQSAPSNAAASAAASAYYQRHQSERHSHQPNSNSGSAGVVSLSSALSLAGTPAMTNLAKAVPANAGGTKGQPISGLLQQPASGVVHSLIPAAASTGFPYIHAIPPVSMKPAEQKPAAGN